jgi:hypothetical protein
MNIHGRKMEMEKLIKTGRKRPILHEWNKTSCKDVDKTTVDWMEMTEECMEVIVRASVLLP